MPYSIQQAFSNKGINPSNRVLAEINTRESLKYMRKYLKLNQYVKAENIRQQIISKCSDNNIKIPDECKVYDNV